MKEFKIYINKNDTFYKIVQNKNITTLIFDRRNFNNLSDKILIEIENNVIEYKINMENIQLTLDAIDAKELLIALLLSLKIDIDIV